MSRRTAHRITAAAPVRTSPNLSDPFRSSGPSRTSPALLQTFPVIRTSPNHSRLSVPLRPRRGSVRPAPGCRPQAVRLRSAVLQTCPLRGDDVGLRDGGGAWPSQLLPRLQPARSSPPEPARQPVGVQPAKRRHCGPGCRAAGLGVRGRVPGRHLPCCGRRVRDRVPGSRRVRISAPRPPMPGARPCGCRAR